MHELGLASTENGIDLSFADPLETAILISLFSDRRLEDIEPSRGFWGDALTNELTGSHLWLLERAKLVPETLRQVEDYACLALEWLVTDGHAGVVTAKASVGRVKELELVIDVAGRRYRIGGGDRAF